VEHQLYLFATVYREKHNEKQRLFHVFEIQSTHHPAFGEMAYLRQH
jgi:hypothetical protein